MKMAKATESDLASAMDLVSALDALTSRWSPMMPEEDPERELESFDIEDAKQAQRALRYILQLAEEGSLSRVVFGCAVMLDPRNKLVDPSVDTIEHHPDRARLEQVTTDLCETNCAREAKARISAFGETHSDDLAWSALFALRGCDV